MNALKSMMKASARVRRDGAEAAIPADQVVAGDVVLLTAPAAQIALLGWPPPS